MGTHHCKYAILFGEDGKVWVVVTSGNFTRPGMVDETWCQCFERRGEDEEENNEYRGDFGVVLRDLIVKQGDSSYLPWSLKRPNYMHSAKFFRQHVGFELSALEETFRWEEAKVELVSTIPGDWDGRLGVRGDEGSDRRVLYGPQRFAQLMAGYINPQSPDFAIPPQSLRATDIS